MSRTAPLSPSAGSRTVIDLRTKDEVDQRGKFPVEVVEVEYHHLPLTDSIPGTEEIRDWGEPQFVSARYRQLLTEGAGSIAQAIHLLATPGSLPAVFHCSAGKDRTGVLAAVVLGCLGVPDAVIIDDYALSSIGTAKLMDSLRTEYADSVEEVEKYAAAILRVMPGLDGGIHRSRPQSLRRVRRARPESRCRSRCRHLEDRTTSTLVLDRLRVPVLSQHRPTFVVPPVACDVEVPR